MITIPEMKCDHLTEAETERFALRKFTVSKDDAFMFNLRAMRDGQNRGITPGEYVKLVEKGKGLWMSDTPAEQRDHRPPLREIAERGGNVLIMGLGIGMVVAAALKCPNVEKVVVVEREQEVIDLVKPQIDDPRLVVIHGDALEMRPPDLVPVLGDGYRLSVFYADVWQDLDTENLQAYGNLKRRWSKVSDFRWCWGEDTLRRVKAQDRRRGGWW